MILQIHNSDDAWLRAAVDLIVSTQGERQSLHLCLSGGTTPQPVYESLARSEAFRALVASKAVHLWVGDEREAPAHSGLRNSEMIEEIFAAAGFGFKNFAFREAESPASHVQTPTSHARSAQTPAAHTQTPASLAHPEQPAYRTQEPDTASPGLILHAWPLGPREGSASAYEEELATCAGETGGAERPLFDLTILGMGQDGHTAGLFTAEDLRLGTDRAVMLTEAPQEPKKRMTLAPHILLSSGKILVLMRGLPKVRLLMANLFGERTDPIGHFLSDQCEVVAEL